MQVITRVMTLAIQASPGSTLVSSIITRCMQIALSRLVLSNHFTSNLSLLSAVPLISLTVYSAFSL